MSLLTVVLVLAMLLWALGFVVSGLVLAEEVLWRRPIGEGAPPISRVRKVGGMLLLVIGGILVISAIVTGFLVAEREAHLIRLETTVSELKARSGASRTSEPGAFRHPPLSRKVTISAAKAPLSPEVAR